MSNREASLPEYISMLGNSDHRAAQEYCELIRGQDKLEKENAKLEEADETVLKAVAAKGQLEVQLQARVAELEAMIHEATEVYAGMEGFIPETAAEGYCLRIIRQMYSALIGGEDE